MPLSRRATGSLVAVAVLLAGGFIWLPLDLDGDGFATLQEWGHGTSPFRADSDGDGLEDGWEKSQGLSPTDADGDDDSLKDGDEIQSGADPTRNDSDDDGILDQDELDLDCDDDGIPSIADGDDDGDHRIDGAEPSDQRCRPDVDGDGVLDGDEGNLVCIMDVDCDDDGLHDGDEGPWDGYDQLDPDSFDVGLTDGIVRTFEENGQPPSRDDDHDGIPDAWEGSDGLIDWGPFDPRPGRTDLLVEFIKVTGPDSDDRLVDLTPSYDRVVGLFSHDGDIHLEWTETTVALPSERRPGFLEPDDQAHFLSVLNQSEGATNPFVTSMILNPQQEQVSLFGEVLGAAFLRSMLGVVDYGTHTTFRFEVIDADGLVWGENGPLEMAPALESQIAATDVQSVPPQIRFDEVGIDTDGRYFMRDNFDPDLGEGITWSWHGEWFQTAPNASTDSGKFLQFGFDGIRVERDPLASTIAHEIGHTLGLCHPHEAECFGQLPPLEQVREADSTMSYNAPSDALFFLPSEWERIGAFIACPPEAPIRLLAESAGDRAILDQKYADFFSNQGEDARSCGDHSPIPRTLTPDDPAPYVAPAAWQDAPEPSGSLFIHLGYGALVIAGSIAAGLGALRRIG